MSEGFEWPGPRGISCGAPAYDRGTKRTISCMLSFAHNDERHHWQEVKGDIFLSASWYGPMDRLTIIGHEEE